MVRRRGAAVEAIRALEGFDRGRYAGPVGWVDARGNGEWAIALRGAQIDGSRARLVAGAGIVTGSDPDAEWAETQAKLEPMLRARAALKRAVRPGRMDPLRDRIVRREPFDTGEGKSGSALERVTLDDGRELVLKHEAPDDLVAQVIPGGADRISVLWESGVFPRAASVVDHGIVTVERDGHEWLVFIRDLSDALILESRTVSRAEHRRIVHGIARLHDTFRGEPLPELCSLADQFRMLAPATVSTISDRDHFLPPLVLRGWELWPDAVPGDVAGAVLAVHDRADDLAAQLITHDTTLIHGDLRLANLGLRGDALALIDWGTLTAVAPSALDWAVYLATDIQRVDVTHDEFLDDIRVAEGGRHDADATSLALLGALAIMGWNKALDLFDIDDEAWRAQQRADLDWWVTQVRFALEIWSPV